MRLVEVHQRHYYNDPDRGTYNVGLARCEEHGEFRGFSGKLEDGEDIWQIWIRPRPWERDIDCTCKACRGKVMG